MSCSQAQQCLVARLEGLASRPTLSKETRCLATMHYAMFSPVLARCYH